MISVLLAAEQCIDAAGVPLYHGLSKRSLLTLINSNQALRLSLWLKQINIMTSYAGNAKWYQEG